MSGNLAEEVPAQSNATTVTLRRAFECLIISTIAFYTLRLLMIQGGLYGDTWELLLQLIIVFSLVVLIGPRRLSAYVAYVPGNTSNKKLTITAVKLACFNFVAGIALLVVSFLLLPPGLPESHHNDDVFLTWESAVYACLIGPVYEEITFRYLLFIPAIRRYGFTRASILVSLIFAMLHGSSQAFLIYTLMSVTLCAVSVGPPRLIGAIVLHCLGNSVTALEYFSLTTELGVDAHAHLEGLIFSLSTYEAILIGSTVVTTWVYVICRIWPTADALQQLGLDLVVPHDETPNLTNCKVSDTA